MALDVYAACPCGSHKKLKFCCHGLEGDIERVVRLQSAKQNKQALQLLFALERRHPQSAWVKNLQAFTLMMDRRGNEAKAPLARVLEQQPDNLYSIALYGLAAFYSDGWKNGKQAIQRAFQRCSGEYPHIIFFLCRSIAEFMGAVGSPLAHRQYLAQAMRLASEENREQVFMELIEFDGDTKVPYMLRGNHDLVQVSGDEAFDKEVRKAFKLSFLGCQEAAAGFFTKLAESSETKLAGDLVRATKPHRGEWSSRGCGGMRACAERGMATNAPRPKRSTSPRGSPTTSSPRWNVRRWLNRWNVAATGRARIGSCSAATRCKQPPSC